MYRKPGMCPELPEKKPKRCLDEDKKAECEADGDCPGFSICCFNSCDGTRCQCKILIDF